MSNAPARERVLNYSSSPGRRPFRVPAVVILALCGVVGGLIGYRFFDASNFKVWVAVLEVDPGSSSLSAKEHASAVVSPVNTASAVAALKARGTFVDVDWLMAHVESRGEGKYVRITCKDTWWVDGRGPVQALVASYTPPGVTVTTPPQLMPRHVVLDFVSVPAGVAGGILAGGAFLLLRRLYAGRRVATVVKP
jgi:hypothetical protein